MTTFSSYQSLRADLSSNCNLLETAWREATRSTEMEDFLGAGVSDDHNDTVLDLIAQARLRLKSDTIEVGIFGEVKRGKSTLINALVGTEVSSMRVTPETAIPVWVESGERKTVAWFDDNSWEVVTDEKRANDISSQRFKNSENKDVVRLVQYVELAWLPEGLRLVDTPGLDDPSLIESYKERTMEELQRVSAAVFVLVSPPGPGGAEVTLLRELSRHAVDHVFLVCNFYPDVWNDDKNRDSVMEYIENTVIKGALETSGTKPKKLRLYAISAKDGLKAINEGNSEEYEKSGVGKLRADIEEFLTNGALKTITNGVDIKIKEAVSLIDQTLEQREILLNKPERVEVAVRELQESILISQRELTSIERSLEQVGQQLGQTLGEILAAPFSRAASDIAGENSASGVRQILAGLENNFASATSRASTEFERTTATALQSAERQLMTSFGQGGAFASTGTPRIDTRLASGNTSTGAIVSRMDWGNIAGIAAVTGVGAGVIGGSLLGGAGTALLIAGPVGWAIGAVAVGLAGLLGGTIFGAARNVDRINADDRRKVAESLREKAEIARQQGRTAANEWLSATRLGLDEKRTRFIHEKETELKRIKAILSQENGRTSALKKVSELRQRIKAI